MPHQLLKHEHGTIVKEWKGRTTVALVYPNTYQTGMANLGFQTIYASFNAHPRAVCERVFFQGPDVPAPLSLESSMPLKAFDLISFSISSENDYVNVVRILRSSGIPVRSGDRGRQYPVILAGGIAVTLNPAPLSSVCDAIFLGEGEEASSEIVEAIMNNASRGKMHVLGALRDIAGIHCPSVETPARTARRWVKDIDGCQARTIVSSPHAGLSGMRLIEISRGCRWKCRFCTASFMYLPPRERSLSSLRSILAEKGGSRPGKTGLVSAMVSDHSEIRGILDAVGSLGQKISVSSLRASGSSREIMEALARSGHKTLTIAPETGSERLRRVINKQLLDREILEAAVGASECGIPNLKLYFLLGLPTETQDDCDAIGELVAGVRSSFRGGRKGMVTVALSPFVPKAWTPFQWVPYDGAESLKEKIRTIQKTLKPMKGVQVKAEGTTSSTMEAFLSRADSSAIDVVEKGLVHGWKSISTEMTPALRGRDREEVFPWDSVDMGIDRKFLWREFENALKEEVTPPCDVARCRACGVC